MPHQSTPEFEQDIMADCMTIQKELTSSYNAAALDSTNDTLRSVFINILTQEHQLHSAVGAAMDKRGWQNVHPASSPGLTRNEAQCRPHQQPQQ